MNGHGQSMTKQGSMNSIIHEDKVSPSNLQQNAGSSRELNLERLTTDTRPPSQIKTISAQQFSEKNLICTPSSSVCGDISNSSSMSYINTHSPINNDISNIEPVPSLILQPPSLSSYPSDSEQGSEQTSSFCSN